jgi:hypothetical protein
MSDTPDWFDLESIIPLKTTVGGKRDAERIAGVSADTIKREYPQYVKQLSKRRCGIKLRDALKIAEGQSQRSPRRRARPDQPETQPEI